MKKQEFTEVALRKNDKGDINRVMIIIGEKTFYITPYFDDTIRVMKNADSAAIAVYPHMSNVVDVG